ncbi:MAG: 5-formyltetrahydrofolate cyclo-ligase [Heliobacteriaceae bacterium]|jgi:5-formyltetrahydrofolate cyclo-ligase|nr:5-formyltetrahydrofolate cyclo-ligase [Heliobacteriaceae bacterium]
MDNKTDLRTRAKAIRKTLDMPALSAELTEKLRTHEFYKSAKNVMIYYPKEDEINVLGLLSDDKNFYLPRVNGDLLHACPYCTDDKLECSSFNVMEPCTAAVDTKILDLIVVPALMADKNNFRLGYGGGFYDRFLAANPGIFSTVLIPQELFIDSLPVESFDIPVNKIIVIPHLLWDLPPEMPE